MENKHSIFHSWNARQQRILLDHGIVVSEGYDSFWMNEDDTYLRLVPYFQKWQVTDSVFSKFSDNDLNNSLYLAENGIWANGYPMPEDDFGYRRISYVASDQCWKCGFMGTQVSPFRLRKSPNWGKRVMFSLNWVYDELFAKIDFYEYLEKKYHIESMPVLLYKRETVIPDVVQLKLKSTDVSLDLDGKPFTVCGSCGRKRYDLLNSGFFPNFINPIGAGNHIFKTKEFFGTGASSKRYIIVSQELRHLFETRRQKLSYIPQLFTSDK